MTAVTLTRTEVRVAWLVAIERNLGALEDGLRPIAGQSPSAIWADHFIGVCGEIALAKYLDLYPRMEDAPHHLGDVSRLEVRTTDNRCLIIRPRDELNTPYVLVQGVVPSFRVAGWLWGREAMQTRYRRAPNGRAPAYFVPAEELHPIAGLWAHL